METDGNTISWRGVPFAKPPVGTLRWQPTQAPDAWTGIRSAKDYADACSQIGGLFGPPPKGKDYSAVWETFYKQIGSEDCLYLNIWSPTAATDASKLPVIVYIHGGSNVVGASFDPLLLGGNLAKNTNAVVVTVAYRLGLFGWFAHPAFNTGDPLRDSGNFALLDLIQSLKFVKNNIANFGGDPGNVTIMGQSAGSTNVNALIVSPLAAGLFHKADLAQRRRRWQLADGGGEQVERDHQRVADQGSARNRQGFGGRVPNRAERRVDQELPHDQDCRRPLRHPGRSNGRQVGHRLAHLRAGLDDGDALGHRRADRGRYRAADQRDDCDQGRQLQQGAAADREHVGRRQALFVRLQGRRLHPGQVDERDLPRYASGLQLEDIIDASIVSPLTVDNYNTYTYNNANHVTPAPSITTATFWALSNASNTAYYPQVPLYAYDFKWNKEPAPWNDVYGAWHAEDLAFIFGNFTMNLEAFGWSDANKPGRLALSNVMQQSVAAFIRTGDPNNASLGVTWDQWTPTAPRRLVFDATLDQATISEE